MKQAMPWKRELCPVQKGRYKALTIMDIIVNYNYHGFFNMLADYVGTGSTSQQVTPE
jgi:hypothetical protein